jgi:putative membrane protein
VNPIFAHPGLPLAPHDLAGAWVADPWLVIPLALSAVLYASGLRRLRRHAAAGERRRGVVPGVGRGIRRWEAGCFAAGWITLAVALVSPLHPMGEVLFSAHMAQHTLLMSVAAPLLVLGRPMIPMLWALPMGWRRSLGAAAGSGAVRGTWRALTRPVAAWALHGAAVVLWHVPALYEATITSDFAHGLQHASFLATALLFWWSLIHGRERRMGYGVAVMYLFATMLYMGGLGALITFAPQPWYAAYSTTTMLWGLTPLEDQQLAGLIMWIPAGTAYLIAALALLAAWMRESERRVGRWQNSVSAASLVCLVLALTGCGERVRESDRNADASFLTRGGDASAGRAKIRAYGCGSCHRIPGVREAHGTVGPSLAGIASRSYVAGKLPNNPDNLMAWILDPQAFDSATAMPNVGVSRRDVRDIAAYLYTLR